MPPDMTLVSEDQRTEAVSTPRILMCSPDHFSVDYAINPWMDPAQWAAETLSLTATAVQEWAGLHRTLIRLGAAVDLVPPHAGLPDLVFTANAAVVLDRKVLLAHFNHPERQREEGHFACAFAELQRLGLVDSIAPMPGGLILEGAGDCVWDDTRRLFWMGYGPRSQAAAREIVAETFGVDAVALELVDPRFYHMDTALCPLTRGEVIYVPGAFSKSGLGEIRARVQSDLRIELAEEDACRFAANAVCLGDDIVLSDCSENLRRDLEDRGYQVHKTPLGSFQRSGGSAFCLTLRLDRRSTPTPKGGSPHFTG